MLCEIYYCRDEVCCCDVFVFKAIPTYGISEVKMKNLFIIIVITAGVLLSFQCKPDVDLSSLKITVGFVTGDVHIELNKVTTPLVPGNSIEKGGVLISGVKSSADLLYGKDGVIRLHENSRMVISELRQTAEGATIMGLEKGKVFVSVSRLVKGSTFGVRTKTTLAAVRGTSFRVSTLEKQSRIDVIAGKVKVNPVQDGRVIQEVEQVVDANQTVSLTVENVQAIVEKKKSIEVIGTEPDVAEEIRQEIKAMPVQVIKALTPEVKQEINNIQKIEQVVDSSAEVDEQKKAEAARRALAAKQKRDRDLAEQQERERQAQQERDRKANEIARQKQQQELIRKKAAEAVKKKKEEEERAGNIPSL